MAMGRLPDLIGRRRLLLARAEPEVRDPDLRRAMRVELGLETGAPLGVPTTHNRTEG